MMAIGGACGGYGLMVDGGISDYLLMVVDSLNKKIFFL